MSNARILLKTPDNRRRLVIIVDNLNNIDNLRAGQQINIQNSNNQSVVNIIRIENRFIIVEVVNSDDIRYFNQNDRITFNPPPAEGFKSKKRSKSKSKKVSKNKKVSKSKKVSKY